MDQEQLDGRLDKMEKQLDRMAIALETLIRIDERQQTQRVVLSTLQRAVKSHNARIGACERAMAVGDSKFQSVERGWWIMVAAALSALASWFYVK